MALIKGGFLRLFQTFLYLLAFLCAALILAIYSYFLATLADRNGNIMTWVKAVEGISGAAVLYTIFAVLLTCCLGGISILAFTAIVRGYLGRGALRVSVCTSLTIYQLLDIAFVGGFIALAVLVSCQNGRW